MNAKFSTGKRLFFVAALGLTPLLANAADCQITTQRTACPGKEQEVLAPYGGKNPTVEVVAAASADSCKAAAEQSSKIVRKGTLKGKTVSAKFGADAAGQFSDTSDCS